MKLTKRRRFVNHKRRIIFYSVFFVLLFISIGYAYMNTTLSINSHVVLSANHSTAVDALVQDLKTNNSTCFTKYEGEVTDRVGQTVTAQNVYFNQCADKRNIIFGGFCWQMIRTTETGGIKMIYNGEAVNGKCEGTRGAHKGIVQINNTNQVLNSSYLYGSSFTYDINTNEFTLVDTISATWSDSTYEDLIGKFTCKSTSDICTILYNVNGYYSDTTAYASSYIIDDVGYSLIGKSSFNSNSSSPAMVGYMFNRVTDTGNGIDDLISATDVNNYNSSIKGIIDNWYAQNLSSKTYMLEDTVYCNDRSLDEFSNLDFGDFLFRGMNTNGVMDCVNITDQFAVSNNSAKLTYPVAIFTVGEINNISYDIPVYVEEQSWWSITPAYFNKTAQNYQIGEWRTNVDENGGIRPAISLATTTRILSGTGLETDPWIVDES